VRGLPNNRRLGNCEAVAKETIWQRWRQENAPLVGGLLFSLLLSLLTVWFTQGAIGPIFCAVGFGLSLVMLGVASRPLQDLAVPLVLSLSAALLGVLSGGFLGAAVCAILWPILAMAGLKSRRSTRSIDWIGTGLGASLGALFVLALLDQTIAIPVYGAIGTQSGILAIGACGALTIAAIIARRNFAAAPRNPDIETAIENRDAALLEAQNARDENRERAQFMAEMSHEIRTPLNAILGFADTMRAQVFGPLPKDYGDYPDLIHTSGSHLLEIVSDLLDLSKIEAGRYETQLKPVSLDELAREGVALSGGDARALGITLRFEGQEKVLVMSDQRALRQMTFNLVSNALKFTPAGGVVTLSTRIDAQTSLGLLEVTDTGMGMSAVALARIGQPWNQSGETDKTGQRGRSSGLGLALVKRLAELQGGTLSLTSALGAGTKAVIALPLAVAPALTPQA
jgi:signal transduction histidine kinase